MDLGNLFDDGIPFRILAEKESRWQCSPLIRSVRWNLANRATVNPFEFPFTLHGGTSHTGNNRVAVAKLLDRNLCSITGLDFDILLFLGLNRLMNAFAPTSSISNTSGGFINDDHLPFENDIMLIEVKISIHLDTAFHEIVKIHQGKTFQVFALNCPTHPRHTLICEFYFAFFSVVLIVLLVDHLRRKFRAPIIQFDFTFLRL